MKQPTTLSILEVLSLNQEFTRGFSLNAVSSGSRLSEGSSLKRENPAHFKNSNLTLSLKRGILVQARISQCQQPQNDISRPGETTLAQARIFQYTPGFHPPRRDNSRSRENLRVYSRVSPSQVTAIMESKDLDSMALATLFGKLQDHEMELGRLTLHEESDKRKNGISLKSSTSQEQEDKDDDC
ncbi:hypothetical protein Lal_00042379 [Lupinus albus]|nr:hypothetical protein Lal_00042379 [Lupinus albus]